MARVAMHEQGGDMDMLVQGVLIGLAIALPPGPKAAVCISRTLTADSRAGLRCGLRAASAHACYAALAVVGVVDLRRRGAAA